MVDGAVAEGAVGKGFCVFERPGGVGRGFGEEVGGGAPGAWGAVSQGLLF